MMIAKTTNKNTAAAESNHDDDSSPAAANWEKLLETGVIKRKSVTFKIDKDFATTAEDESKEVAVDNDEEGKRDDRIVVEVFFSMR